MAVDIVGGGPGRLITKPNTAGASLLSVAVTSVNGGTSAYGQVIASTSAGILITGVGFYSGAAVSGTATAASIDIAYGGAGSESILDSEFIFNGSASANWVPGGWTDLAVPQQVASGQRVAVRLTQLTGFGSGPTCTIYLATVPVASLETN